MLSAERHFEIDRSLELVSKLSLITIPTEDGVEPGSPTPFVFAARPYVAGNLAPGDTFVTMTGLVGVLTPIEWTVVEKTTQTDLLATRRGRYQIVSKGLMGATATIVLNLYEVERSVSADLFVLIDEVILSGKLQDSFMTALETEIDTLIARAQKRFAMLRNITVVEEYPPRGRR